MTLPRLICAVLLLPACIPGAKSLGQGETGDEGSGDDDPVAGTDGGSSPDDGATSMVGTDSGGATTGGECEPLPPEPCGPPTCDPSCTALTVCVEGSWTCECECSDTGEPGSTSTGPEAESGDTSGAVCEIVETATEMAEQSKSPPIDCGDITTDDPVAAWQAAHDCAIGAAAIDDAFVLIVDMQGIDSFPRRAFVGMEGRAYQRVQLDQDFGGINPGPQPINYRFCDEIVATPGCTPAVADICITCMGLTDSDVLCEP